jgi:hypothetical protein
MPWDLTGNNGTNPANNFLGTTDQQPLVIRTNNTERVRLTPDGDLMASRNVTIGAGGDAVLRVRHIFGKGSGNDNDDALYLNWNTGKPVVIGRPEGRASLSVSGDATIGAGSDGVLKVRHILGKGSGNDNDDALYLNWNTGKPVVIGRPERRASLSVNGEVQSTSGGFRFPDGSVQTTATLRGPQGPQGPQGSPGPAVHTSAVCAAAATCDCFGGRLISRVFGPCAVTSDTGPCSHNGAQGSCCVCAPG